MIPTTWILVQKREEGIQPGGRGGHIYNGFPVIERREAPPEEPWYDYLLDNYGEGRYLVTTQAQNGKLMALFAGRVAYTDEEAVRA